MTTPASPKDKLKEVQAKTDVVLEVMRENITRTIERGDTLEKMEQKAAMLEESARQFERNANAVRRQMCCQHYKLVAFVVIAVLIVLIIILAAAGVFNN